jgi:hypothetical protein
MDILSNALPACKSYAVRGWHFVRSVAAPALGTLTITQGANTKDIATYRVVECPGVSAPARGFRLAKVAGGTDREAGNYDVLIDPAGHDACECRGYLRHGRCKHLDAVRDLLADGALNPDCPTCAGNGYIPTADLSAEPCLLCTNANAAVRPVAVAA